MTSPRFDSEIFSLIPHREPMLLINSIVQLSADRSETLVLIDAQTPFMGDNLGVRGVPAWIGLEYMGQTSALIAGYQEREGLCEPHLGFLMGSRKYQSNVDQFTLGQTLRVICEQGTLVGTSLANFNCRIENSESGVELANASLSVFRRPLNDINTAKT